MPCSRSFVDHALDLLSLLGPVQARRMFGGYGIYARGVMFGVLDDDELFLKTDGETEERFASAGCRRWSYDGLAQTDYFRPPDEAHEDAEAMEPWGRLGLEAALRKKRARDARAAAAAARRAERERKPAAEARRSAPKPRRAAPGASKPAARATPPAAPRRRRGKPRR